MSQDNNNKQIKNTEHPFKNNQMPFPMKVLFSVLSLNFKVLGVVSPTLGGKLALRIFMTPPKFGTPRREKQLRDEATQYFIGIRNRQISVRSWGAGPTILLSHGWAGRSSQFHAFIGPLVAAGYRVVGFEIPGHGDSTGKRTNMLDVAHILSKVAEKEGPVEAIIGHSFGTGTTLLAIDKYKVKTNKIVLISAFSNVSFIINMFKELFDLRSSTVDAMKNIAMQRFATTYETSWNWDEISPLVTIESYQGEILLIHDDLDHEVPIEEALPLHQSVPRSKTLITSGFGHRRILMNNDVIQTTLDFITK